MSDDDKEEADNKTFFISRAGPDRDLALQIAKMLQMAGYKTVLQQVDFGHSDFMAKMHDALKSDARVIALLSHQYFERENCLAEALGALTGDIFNKNQRLIPMRITDCAPEGLLANLIYLDLVPLLSANDATALQKVILAAVEPGAMQQSSGPVNDYLRQPAQRLHANIRPQPHFTGRKTDFATLKQLLNDGDRAAITGTPESTAVSGMGGIGKSVLALQYAWEYKDDYHGIWWLVAETDDTILDGLITLGSYDIPGLNEEQDRHRAVELALNHLETATTSGKPWLLIYDNIERPEQLHGRTPRQGAHCLITSRWEEWQSKLPLGLFEREEAIIFLQERAERRDEQGAAELAELLGDLPLALEHAAAHCRKSAMSFTDYAKHYRELLKKKPRGTTTYPDSVWTTFNMALDKIIHGNDNAEPCIEAYKLMGIIAHYAPDDIPLDLITDDVLNAVEKSDAVSALSENSLITLTTLEDGRPAISVHRLVQEVMKDRLGEEANDAYHLAKSLLQDQWPGGTKGEDPNFWPICVSLLPHARAFLSAVLADDNTENPGYFHNQVAYFLVARADFEEAELLVRRALAITEASYGPDHPNVATTLNNLAELLKSTNRLEEAEPLYRRAFAIDESSFGPDHPNVARGLNNLAVLLRATNRLEEAEPLYRRALAIDEASFGPDHPNVARGLNNLALLLQDTNRLEEAEPLAARAADIMLTSLGPDHPNTQTVVNTRDAIRAERAAKNS